LLSELTIVIPTYNRPLELERSIEYWRDTPVTVHILDGSDKPWFPVGLLPGAPNITYHYFEPMKDEYLSVGYRTRMRFAAQLPTTRFAALIGEDDFFVVSGLCSALRILKTKKSIGSITGFTVGFGVCDSLIAFNLRDIDQLFVGKLEDPQVKKRISGMRSGLTPILYYGIFQASVWRRVFSLTFQESYTKNFLQGERILNAIAIALAPTTVINSVIWLRQFERSRDNIDLQDQIDTYGDYHNFLLDKKNKSEVARYFGVLARAIVVGSPRISRNTSNRLARKALKPYFWNSYAGISYRSRKAIISASQRIRRLIPHRIRIFLNDASYKYAGTNLGYRKYDMQLKPLRKSTDSDSFILQLAKAGVEFQEHEFQEIQNLLLMPREELRLRADI
jgi:hypothetical protein